MDEFGYGGGTFERMVPTLRRKFDCLLKSALRLTLHKWEIGMTSIHFLGNTITPKGLTPETAKIEKVLKTMNFPATVRQVKRLVGFFLFFRMFFIILLKNLCLGMNYFGKMLTFTNLMII